MLKRLGQEGIVAREISQQTKPPEGRSVEEARYWTDTRIPMSSNCFEDLVLKRRIIFVQCFNALG